MLVLFTMIFNGGIVPLYLIMKSAHLTGTLWSVILAGDFSAFNMILMMNYFQGLPESLMESARLDGAGEWKILFSVVLPLAAPIIATITLFYGVAYWNSWYDAMIFLRKADQLPAQNVLRTIIVESQTNASNRQRGFRRKGQFLDRYENGGRIRHHGADYVLLPVLQNILPKGY